MGKLIERCAALDVHRDSITACVRVPDEAGARRQEIRAFGTVTAELLELRDWLRGFEVSVVGMESTGVYWQAVYYLLEDEFDCWLLNAQHIKNVPGRKTDVADAAWICQMVEHGLVRSSFVPPKPIRRLRDLTRYRKSLIQERTREAQRLEKFLQDAGIKLSSVVSDKLGVSGRAILQALVEGTLDPEAMADLAKGRLRANTDRLRQALEGRFEAHHALMVGEVLAHIDFLDESIDRLSGEIGRVVAPFAALVKLLKTIPGVDQRAAEVILAEIGPDMSRFLTAAHLASWAGICPGNNESAGKHRSGRSRKGNHWLRITLTECAQAAARSKGSYFSAQYARIRGRRGPKKAIGAVRHSILVAAWHVLKHEKDYTDLGADYFLKREGDDAYKKRLVHQLERLGYNVELQELARPA
jgi:transposase